MKPYLVFTTDLALAPLQGQNLRGGGRLVDFDDLDEAQAFAEEQKGLWGRVFIFRHNPNGELERTEHYKDGQKYIGNKRVRHTNKENK